MINSVRVGDPVAYESARKVFKIVEVVEVVASISLSTAIGLVVREPDKSLRYLDRSEVRTPF